MKLGSLKEGGRDGTLVVVSKDLARAVIRPTAQAMAATTRQADYQDCWAGLKKNFTGMKA